ncbi:MAG: DUF3135 domain-containing protein [Limnobacter sp.]|uniref:DUF3135 domain-containing protein n=1 Tax=Limnobacter sp. TaxID=2003368 RepID=UPI00391BA75E
MADFDFNEWANLHAVDPEAFDARKDAVLAQLVERTAPENRLGMEQALFRIRMNQERAKSPLQSAMQANKLMWESFGVLRQQLEQLTEATAESTAHQAPVLKRGSNRLRLINPDSPELADSTTTMAGAAVSSVVETQQPAVPSAKVLAFRASNKPVH